jgi:hypothetical protein
MVPNVPELLSTLITVGGTVAAGVGGPLLSGVLQNRQDARLRRSVKENSELAVELRASPTRIASKADDLDELIVDQIDAVIRHERRKLNRRYDWSSLGVVVLLAAIFVPIMVLLWRLDGKAWTALFWVVGVILLMFTLVGLGMTFWPEDKSAKKGTGTPESAKAA